MAGSRWCTVTLALAPTLAGCTADDSFADDGGYVAPDATLYDAPSFPRPDAQPEGAAPDASLDADATVDAMGDADADADGTLDADGPLE